jgi:ABC-type bacteriocin/lantibiotic exporter with double-glycine peptidase domain
MIRAPFPTDVASLPAGVVRGGINVVHARLAHLAAALRAPRREVTEAQHRALMALMALTILINVLALVAPLVTLAVFDYVVRDGAPLTLVCLCATGGLAIVYELNLRRRRSELAADMGVKAAAGLATRLFGALLARDVRDSGPVATSSDIARFRALRQVRAVLTGPVVGALLDAPFTIGLIVVLFVHGGPLGFVPLGAVLTHAVVARVLRPFARSTAQHGARARELLRVALAESAAKRETLDEIGMCAPWAARIEVLAVEAASRRGREREADAALDAAAHAVTALAVIAALWIGAGRVMDGAMSIGAVMAAMMLIWRCVAPLETVFRSWTQVRAVVTTAREAGRQRTHVARATHLAPHGVVGAVAARGLVVRPDRATSPALRGVSFDVAAGELVAICGPAGSGKSTLLTTILGLHSPESGTVAIDGRDLRGLEAGAYRTQVAYAPQTAALFHGTVAQNIRLVAPGVDTVAMTDALARAGVALPHPQLPQGVETRLKSGGGGDIDESLRVKIMLAGLYAKNACLLLLDDPGAFLDRDGDRAFLKALHDLRGRTTVLLVTNRPSHMRVCDRIIRLEHGMVVTDGSVERVLGR